MSDLATTFETSAARTAPLNMLSGKPLRPTDSAADAQVFPGLLDQAMSAQGSVEEQLRDAAQKLVSTTFIMPLFSQLRSDPLAANLLHGGQAEEVFQQQLDQVFSDRIAAGTNFDLVDSVYNQLYKTLPGAAVDVDG